MSVKLCLPLHWLSAILVLFLQSSLRPNQSNQYKFSKQFLMKKFLLTLLLACTIGVAGAWADSYTIEFQTGTASQGNGTTISSSVALGDIMTKASLDYVSSVQDYENAYYQGTNGLKFGTSSKTGKITINIAEAYQVKATKVTFNVAYYNKDTTAKIKATIDQKSETYSLSSDLSDKSMVLDGTEVVKAITIETTKRAWVKSITVEYTPEPSGPVAVTPVFSPLEAEQNTLFTLSAEPADFIADVTNLEFASNDILMEVVNGEIQGIAAEFTGDYEVNVSWGEGTKYAAGSTSFTFTVTAP